MTRITGLGGQIFMGPPGSAEMVSVGFSAPMEIQLHAGEYVIPPGTVKKFTRGLLTATGTFSGTFAGAPGCYFGWESPEPDKDGWEPRTKWNR